MLQSFTFFLTFDEIYNICTMKIKETKNNQWSVKLKDASHLVRFEKLGLVKNGLPGLFKTIVEKLEEEVAE